MLRELTEKILLDRPMSLKTKIKLRKFSKPKTNVAKEFSQILNIAEKKYDDPEHRLSSIYTHLTRLSDELLKNFINFLISGYSKGDLSKLLKKVPSTISGLIVYVPVLFALKYLNKDIEFQKEVMMYFNVYGSNHKKRVLWFTDTIADLMCITPHPRNTWYRSEEKKKPLFTGPFLTQYQRTDQRSGYSPRGHHCICL